MAEDHGHEKHGGGEGGEHKAHKAHRSHGPAHGGNHEEHAGAPEWLISFADNTALLMGFFVILLAMNMSPKQDAIGGAGSGPGGSNEDQLMAFIEGLREAFHNPITEKSKSPGDQAHMAWKKRREEEAKGRKDKGVPGGFQESGLTTPNGTKVSPHLVVEFEQGTATLTQAFKNQIAVMAERDFKGKDWIVEVRGHVSAMEARQAEREALNAQSTTRTENSLDEILSPAANGPVGIGSGAGYRLSYERAMVVAHELARHGVEWRKLRVVACSDMQRAVARADSDPTQHRRNQRVEIIQSSDLVPKDPGSIEPGGDGH